MLLLLKHCNLSAFGLVALDLDLKLCSRFSFKSFNLFLESLNLSLLLLNTNIMVLLELFQLLIMTNCLLFEITQFSFTLSQ